MTTNRIFISGTGTGIGKTMVAAILVEALQAEYWKPVQAGYANGTDSQTVKEMISNEKTVVHPETYTLKLAASPHIASREENIRVDLDLIVKNVPVTDNKLIIEGAGGLMVPLNDNEFVSDLILKLGAQVILVSRNTLGSINHSLLTAMACRQMGIPVIGWIFNDRYLDYESDIEKWSGIKKLAHIPFDAIGGKEFILKQASIVRGLSENWSW